MAIKDFKNIENINLNLDSTAQLVSSKDLNVFKTIAKNVTDFGMSKNDVIEFRLYDLANNLLQQTNGVMVRYIHKDNLTKYLKSDIDPLTQEKVFDIDVEKLVNDAGYGNGEFNVVFNFVKNYIGLDDKKQRVWIHEISPSRTEIRIQPLITTDVVQNAKINSRYNSFIDNALELRENIELIKKQIDSIQLQISDLIDNYLIQQHGPNWLSVVKKDFKFGNDSQYKAFKEKIFTDFKQSLYNQFDGKEYKLGNSNYGQLSSQPLDLDEFYNTKQVQTLLINRLSDSIDFNMKNITFIDYPQSIKDVLKNKVDNQLLQSLLTTTAIATSRLTRNDKLTGLDKNIIITPNTPIKEDIIIKRKPAVEPPLVEQPMPTPEIIVEPIPVLIDYAPRGGGGGFGGEIIDNSRLGGGMGREQLFNNDGLNEQRENLR
jgi:hypothetical protein